MVTDKKHLTDLAKLVRHGGSCLQSQNLGGGGRRLGSPRVSSAYRKFKGSLGYMRPCLKKREGEGGESRETRGKDERKMDWLDCEMSKGTCIPVSQPEFDHQDPNGKRK